MPNLKHLYYFHIYAQELSTSRAAKILRISSPALSNQLKHLEDYLGIPLTRRSNGKTLITEQGELVKTYTDRMFSVYAELQSKLSLDKKIRGNRFRVGICNFVGQRLSFDMLSFLKKSNLTPSENLKIAFHNSDHLLEGFQQGLFDIIIGSFDHESDSRIESVSKHLQIPVQLFVPAQLLDGETSNLLEPSEHNLSRIIEIANSKKISLVVPLNPSLLRDEIERFLSSLPVRPDSTIECNNSSTITQLIERGFGMGFFPTTQPSTTNLNFSILGPKNGYWNHRVSILIKNNEERFSKVYSNLDSVFSF